MTRLSQFIRPYISRLAVALAGLALASLTVPALGQEPVSARQLDSYTERVQTGFINWAAGYAEVDVEATYDTVRHGSSHAKIRAIEDAENKADDALFRLIRGVNISGDKRIAGDGDMETALKKVIPKSRKMDIGKIANVTMNARFTMPIPGKKGVLGAVYSAAATEGQKGLVADSAGGSHTSVVFDASKTSLQAALFPRVSTESGDVVFAAHIVDPKIINRGMAVHYVIRAEDAGKKKAGLSKTLARSLGDNPLVIEVGKIGGDFLADIVLRDDQVEKMRQAKVGDLLTQGLVFIIQTESVDATQ